MRQNPVFQVISSSVDSASKTILCIGLCDSGRLTVEASEAVMSEQYATLLKKARERLVEDRRAFAKIIAAPFEREKTVDARARFVELQATIEAIDRAIEDERSNPRSAAQNSAKYSSSHFKQIASTDHSTQYAPNAPRIAWLASGRTV